AAAEVLRQFEDAEIEAICKEMTNFQVIDPPTQAEVLRDFAAIIGAGASALTGGAAFARRTIELAKGDSKAASMLEKIAPGTHSADGINELGEMESRQVYNLLKNEQPQTVAFLLSYLEPAKSAEIVGPCPGGIREEIIERLSTRNSTPVEIVSKVARALTKNLTKAKVTMHTSGGVRTAAEVLNTLDRETAKQILSRLEQRDP